MTTGARVQTCVANAQASRLPNRVATGASVQLECATTTDRYGEDAVLVEMQDLREVVARICIGPDRAVVGDGVA